jgi:tRNA modification GTPase
VSDIPGTTRDTVEDACTIQGLRFRFIDTAGLRDTQDVVEAEGIRRALDKAASASTVLLMLDASTDTPQDAVAQLNDLDLPSNAHVVVVWNKCDLATPAQAEWDLPLVHLSAAQGQGVDALKDLLTSAYQTNDQGHQLVVTNLRHFEALTAAHKALQAVREGLANNMPGDLVAVDARQALHHLGEITGAVHADDILGHIFSHFCIGK